MFYKNILNREILIALPRGEIVSVPPLGFILGRWYKLKKIMGLVKVNPSDVDVKKIVWYPKDALNDIENPAELFEKLSVIRKGGKLELYDYIGAINKAKSGDKSDSKVKKSSDEKVEEKVDLNNLSYKELLALAKDKNAKFSTIRPKKADLIKILEKIV